MKAATNAVRRVAALVCLTLLMRGEARATDYCPLGFYGYMNGYYMYYCHYCDGMGGCQAVGIAAGHLYSCGGDFACCTPDSTCTDPIPPGDVHLCGDLDAKRKDRVQRKDDVKPGAKKKAAVARHIPTEIGDIPQRDYVSQTEKFCIPGPHITIKEECVVVDEADGTDSYFRVIEANWAGHPDWTICFGMEMDPVNHPTKNVDRSALSKATRKSKTSGYQHTITVRGKDYDASSMRKLK